MKKYYKAWIALAISALLSPLGIIMPAHLKAGGAWGEWGADEMTGLVGYLPKGLGKLSTFWQAPLPDYAINRWGNKGLAHLSLAYIISAFLGIIIIFAVFSLIGKFLINEGEKTSA